VNTATSAASALMEMGPAAAPAVPSLIQTLQERRDDGTFVSPTDGQIEPNISGGTALRRAVIVALGNIGPAAKEAVPILRQRLKDQGEFSLYNRVFSAKALWQITGNTGESLPVLVRALKNDDSFWAADILGLMGADAKSAIPDLQGALQSRVGYTRLRAALALTRIDPQFPLPMSLLLELLGDANPITRVDTAGIIWSVNHDPQVIVPTLLGLMKPDEQDPTGYGACEQAIALLGEIGPPAKAAIPALKTLEQSPNSHIRGLAAEALKKIEAETEAKPQAAPPKGQ